MAAKKPTIYVFDGEVFVRAILARDAEGRFQADPSSHPLSGRAADTAAELFGLRGSVNPWLREWVPSATPVAETPREAAAFGRRSATEGVWSKNGRQAPWGDAPLDPEDSDRGVCINFKLMTTDGHKCVVVTTASADTAEAQLADFNAARRRGARWACVVIAGEKYRDGVRVDIRAIRYQVLTAAPLMGHSIESLRAQGRGAGRPKKGTILPSAWCTWKDTDCVKGSEVIYLRAKQLSDPGWSVGTIEEIKEAARRA